MRLIDAVPVVRCKDCKHSDVAFCRDGKTVSKTEVWCLYNEDRHRNNYYCADGARKCGGAKMDLEGEHETGR